MSAGAVNGRFGHGQNGLDEATDGLNGNREEVLVKLENGVANGLCNTNGKQEDNGHSPMLVNGNGLTVANGNMIVKEEEEVMHGIEEIKISDMDVDEDTDKAASTNGIKKSIESIKQSVSPTPNGLYMLDSTMKMAMGTAPDNTINAPPPIVPKCSNGKLMCGLDGVPSFPCKRCHRVFYCSDEHRQQHYNDHQPDCKTVSSLEVINYEEDYSMWLKHSAPHLYDICLNFVLVWPSLTVQWLPEVTERENNILRHHLLVGTMTNQEQNHLLICGIDIPDRTKTDNALEHAAKYDGTLYVIKRINHEAEVNRARYMPQDCNIVATKSSSPDVFIFDVRKYPDVPEDSQFAPLTRLRGHKKEGFGLSWNLKDRGKLLSGSYDALVCLWDVNKSPTVENNVRYINAIHTFRGHQDVVEDVDWHPEQRNVFASVGDDKRLILWDTRAAVPEEAIHMINNAHELDINAVSFSPFCETCLATGSSDNSVAVWDLRNMSTKLHSLEYHQAEVMQVQWSPHNSSILASTGKDNRVFVWDLAKAGKQTDVQSMEDDSAPSELAFIHGGHIANVNDISWNHHEMGMIASVTEDNILQVWKINEDLQATYRGEDDSDNESGGSVSESFDD